MMPLRNLERARSKETVQKTKGKGGRKNEEND